MKHQSNFTPDLQAAYDVELKALDAAKDRWARTSLDERIAVLQARNGSMRRVRPRASRKAPLSWGRNGHRGPMPSCPAATV